MTAITTFAAAIRSSWRHFVGRDAAQDVLAGLCPNLCKEAGLPPRSGTWTR